MTSATAASFLAEKSTEGAALPKVNVVMDAPDAPLQSSDYMAAAMRASKASTAVTLFGAEAMELLHAIKASMSKAKGMTSATAASFLAETSTEGAALPKVNVVMDAPDAPLQSSDYMAAAMRASKASTGVTLFGAEAMDLLHAIKA